MKLRVWQSHHYVSPEYKGAEYAAPASLPHHHR